MADVKLAIELLTALISFSVAVLGFWLLRGKTKHEPEPTEGGPTVTQNSGRDSIFIDNSCKIDSW
jgi:hypothetical protein